MGSEHRNSPSFHRFFSISLTVVLGIAGAAPGFATESGCPGIHKTITVDGPGGFGSGVVIRETLVLADRSHGITTWSLADPDRPVQSGTFNLPNSGLAWSLGYDTMRSDRRNTVFVRPYLGQVWAFDVRNPTDPKPLWNLELWPGVDGSQDFDVRGSFLVLAGVSMQVFDIGNPVEPVLVGSAGLIVHRVSLTDRHIVTSSLIGGFEAYRFDGINPPERVWSFRPDSVDGNTRLMATEDLVFLSHAPAGVLDLSAGSQTEIVDLRPILGWYAIEGIASEGRIVYATVSLGDGSSRLEVVDFEDPAHPVLIDAIDDWGVPVLGEDRLYRLTWREVAVHGLDQGLPVSGGLGPLGGAAEKLLFDGEIGVLGDGSGGLVTYDFQDPDDPIELGRVLVEGYVDDVAVADGYAFLAADEGGFVVVDYRNPGAPRVVAEHSLAGRALDIALDGDLALVTRRNTVDNSNVEAWLDIFDVSAPSSPLLLASVAGHQPARATAVAARDGVAYFASHRWVSVIDLSTPESPTELSAIEVAFDGGYNHQIEDLALAGDRLLAACRDSGLAVVDVSDPTAPFVEHRFPQYASVVGTDGDKTYASFSGRVTAVDLDAPDGPTWRWFPNRRWIWAITPWRDRLYLASPPFVEIMSLGCDAPEASFEWHAHSRMVFFTNTSEGWWDQIEWISDDGTFIEDVRDPMALYVADGSSDVTLRISGDGGISEVTHTVTIEGLTTAPRLPDGRSGD